MCVDMYIYIYIQICVVLASDIHHGSRVKAPFKMGCGIGGWHRDPYSRSTRFA